MPEIDWENLPDKAEPTAPPQVGTPDVDLSGLPDREYTPIAWEEQPLPVSIQPEEAKMKTSQFMAGALDFDPNMVYSNFEMFDDIPDQETVTQFKQRVESIVKPVPALAAAGYLKAASAVAGFARIDAEEVDIDVITGAGFRETKQSLAERWREEVKIVNEQIMKENPLERNSWSDATRNAFVSIYTQAPAYAVGLLLRGRAVALGLMGTQAGLEKGAELQAAGYEDFQVIAATVASGGSEILTEMIPFDAFIDIVKKSPGMGKNLVKLFLGEQIGEQINTVVDSTIDKVTINKDMTWEEYLERVEMTAKATLVQSMLMGGGAASARLLVERGDLETTIEDMPEEVREQFEEIKAGIKGDELRKDVTALNELEKTDEGKAYLDEKIKAEGIPTTEQVLERITTEELTDEQLTEMLDIFAEGQEIITEDIEAVSEIKNRLIDIGMPEEEASSNAALYAGFDVLAKRAGVPLDDLITRYLPEISQRDMIPEVTDEDRRIVADNPVLNNVITDEAQLESFDELRGIRNDLETELETNRDTWTEEQITQQEEAIDYLNTKVTEEQLIGGIPRGRIRFYSDRVNIDLLKDADQSTFVHETGHLYLMMMNDLANVETASQELKDDFQIIKDWLGVEDGEITRDQNEQFARGFEAYLREGKAPTPALKKAFENFKKWLMEIYRSLSDLDVELTDDVRGAMDRMFIDEGMEAPVKEFKQPHLKANKPFEIIKQLIEENEDNYDSFGLRVLPEDQTDEFKIGDILPNSFFWEEGVQFIDQELNGTSALSVGPDSVEKTLLELGAGDKYNKTFSGYHGKQVVLLGSNWVEDGNDPGEIVMQNAVVIGVFDKKSTSIGPGGGLKDITVRGEVAAAPGVTVRDADGVTYDQEGQIVTKTKAFKDWFGDSKVVDENGEPLVVYHGSPVEFDAFDPKKLGAGHDVEGAGFYFTNDREEAEAYRHGDDRLTSAVKAKGPVYEVYLKIENPVPLEGEVNRDEIEKIVLSSIGLTDASQLESWFENDEDAFWESSLSNWDENPTSAYYAAIDAIMEDETPHQAFQTVWYDIFNADNEAYMNAMLALGYDGVIIKGEDRHAGNDHYLSFSPTNIKSVENKGTFDPSKPSIFEQPPTKTTFKEETEPTFSPRDITSNPVPADILENPAQAIKNYLPSHAEKGQYFYMTANDLQAHLDKHGDGFLYRVGDRRSVEGGFERGKQGYLHKFATENKKTLALNTSLEGAKKYLASSLSPEYNIIYRIMPQDLADDFIIHIPSNEAARNEGDLIIHSPKPASTSMARVLYSQGNFTEEDTDVSRRAIEERRAAKVEEGTERATGVRVRPRVAEGRPERVGAEAGIREELEQAPKKPSKITNIRQLAKSLGGIDYNRENLKGELRKLIEDAPATRYIINRKNQGVPLDKLLENAIEAGMLSETATLDDLLEALKTNLKTPEAIQAELEKEERAEKRIEEKAQKIEDLRKAFVDMAKKARKAYKEGKDYAAVKEARKLKNILARARKIRIVRDYFNLSDADLKKISRKNPLLMSQYEFKLYLDDVRVKAVQLTEEKLAKAILIKTIHEKDLNKVDNYRRVLNLPPISKMTTNQAKTFAEALEAFHDGDTFLSERELETVDRTDLEGIKTWREARERLAKEVGVSVEELSKIKVKEWDEYKWDTALAEANPFYKMLVTETTRKLLEADMRTHDIENEVFELAKKSEKSRGRTLAEKAIPQDRQIMEYLETPVEERDALISDMTPEQVDLAHYMESYFANALEYLIQTKALSRGRENYFVHMRRTFLENVKEEGILGAFRDLFKTYQEDEATFNILDDDTGNILPLEKFFQFALRRTGGLKPTTNVIRGFLGYAQMLEKKRSLDELIPKMDIYAQSLTPEIYTPRGLEIDRSIKQFVNKYINNKKGRHIRWIAKQGGTIDVSIRGLRTFTTMMDLGLNIPTGVAAFVGEQVANFEMLGTKGYAKGTARIKTAKGKAIIDKYEAFVGRSAWEEFKAPGKQLTERISDGLFGLFHEASVLANKQFLLGVLTEAEYNSGEISSERLAEIKIEMGRFRVVPGTKSLVGSTSAGSAMMQYKTWAAPIIRTLSKNAVTMTKDLGSKPAGEALTTREAREIYRFIALSTTAVIVGAMAASDDDDESFTGQLLKKMYRESMTLLQGVDPTLWLATPRIMGFLTQLGKNLKAIATLEEYKTKPGLKGVDGLQRQLTPRAVKQVLPEKKKTEKL